MSVNIVNKSTGALTKIAGNPVEQASGISYDHTSSGMSATNVQGAVDELNSNITTLGNNVASINKSARHYSIDANTPYVLDLSDIGSYTLLFAFSHPYGSANGAVGLYLASNGYTAGYGVENVLASQDITITKTGQKEFTITSTKSTLLTVLGGTR